MNNFKDKPRRPKLTLPEAEAELLKSEYERANVILEYGSGGSTIIAGELGKRVFSVESDKQWAHMMQNWIDANPVSGDVRIVCSNIGPTKQWGHPVDDRAWNRFPSYPLEVWGLPEFEHPEAVLVDGRFRVGCALACAYRINRPITLCFDDYANREQYHVVEQFIGAPVDIIGRMARFELVPQPIPPEKLLEIIRLMHLS